MMEIGNPNILKRMNRARYVGFFATDTMAVDKYFIFFFYSFLPSVVISGGDVPEQLSRMYSRITQVFFVRFMGWLESYFNVKLRPYPLL